MGTTHRNRQPAGVPTGGQFSQSVAAEADIELDAPAALTETSRGEFEVLSTVTEHVDSGMEGVTRVNIHMGGKPDMRAAALTAGLRMQRSGRGDEVVSKVAALTGKKATVLTQDSTGSVTAKEGTIVRDPSGGMILLNKGSRTRGVWLSKDATVDPAKVLAVEPGYGKAPVLAAEFAGHAAEVPELTKATFDDIPVADAHGEPPSGIAAVFLVRHPGFGDGTDGRGTMFLATDRQLPDEDGGQGVLNGYMVMAPESGMVSEHGSMYEADIERMGGRVAGYKPGSHTFRDAMSMGGDEDIEGVWSSIRAVCE